MALGAGLRPAAPFRRCSSANGRLEKTFRKSEQREREQHRAKRHLWGPRDAVTGVGPTGSLLYVRVAVDDDDSAAGEQPVDDETNADVRRVLADRRADLRHDLLGRHPEAERSRSDRDDRQTVSVLEQDHGAGPAGSVEGARAGDGGAGQRVADDHQLEVGDARDLYVALEV